MRKRKHLDCRRCYATRAGRKGLRESGLPMCADGKPHVLTWECGTSCMHLHEGYVLELATRATV